MICDAERAFSAGAAQADRDLAAWIGVFLRVVQEDLDHLAEMTLAAAKMNVFFYVGRDGETLFKTERFKGQDRVRAQGG